MASLLTTMPTTASPGRVVVPPDVFAQREARRHIAGTTIIAAPWYSLDAARLLDRVIAEHPMWRQASRTILGAALDWRAP